ncbi:hypothetical protein ACSCB1_02445 [Streptomyces europaeiscabiei]|uniref:hypothetical protein n=1 Tax=Streptomyces europaeiscabiei TaxID=146819 RepID=UPI00069AB56E|nr:hypothetical protein [Streptomyces europaeiscabiei]MDX3783529.1 hypothetical protein [Streptomyces europaeiscabiei]
MATPSTSDQAAVTWAVSGSSERDATEGRSVSGAAASVRSSAVEFAVQVARQDPQLAGHHHGGQLPREGAAQRDRVRTLP